MDASVLKLKRSFINIINRKYGIIIKNSFFATSFFLSATFAIANENRYEALPLYEGLSFFEQTQDQLASLLGIRPLLTDFTRIHESLSGPVVLSFNSGNPAKTKNYKKIFSYMRLPVINYSAIDLREIDADPIDVIVHKASQFTMPGVIVDDASLYIQGANVGINVKWLIRDLPKYIGKEAKFITLLAFRHQEQIYVFQGEIKGTIVEPRGVSIKGFEFDPYFQPLGKDQTLAENLRNEVNPRFFAVKAVKDWQVYATRQPILNWKGRWQRG